MCRDKTHKKRRSQSFKIFNEHDFGIKINCIFKYFKTKKSHNIFGIYRLYLSFFLLLVLSCGLAKEEYFGVEKVNFVCGNGCPDQNANRTH